MATVVAARFSSNDDSPNGDVDGDGGGRPNTLFDESQAGVIEMASMIADPNLKRAESTDMLHLNLHQLCRDGDIDSLKKFLQYMTGNVRKKINHHDDEDLSPLHYAARYNHVPVVQALVEYGANVNDVDEEGASPLHFAARYKRMRLSTLASPTEGQKPEEGDDENKDEDDNGAEFPQESTPENSVIMYLESKGGDVNAGDTYGCTPLHFAAMRGNEVATKELLSCKGINIEAVDKQQMTALHLAASHNEVEVVRMLIEKGANLRCCDEDMGTPLHFACMEGSMEVVRMLFEAGEKHDGWVTVSQMVTDQDNQQNTSLHLAVENRSLDVAKLCIEKGANVNTPRTNYQTPLHLAAMAGEKSISELLIEHGARVDALDINQETPLYKAAAYDHSDVVEYLLEKGARINRHDKDNFSPLLIAACNGHAKTIRTLLEMGANLYDMDKNDKTCMFWCAEEDNDEALQTILEHPKSKELLDWSDRYDNTPLHIAAQKGYLNCVKLLIDAGADVDAKNEEEQTPLHLAGKNGKTNVVRELVRRDKMVINDEDEDSNTALHLAALAGHNKVAQALLDAGADIEARNCTLWTPLDCAAAKGWHKTCKVLLEADAPIDPMDKSKTTPLHLASMKGHVQVVNLLVQWNASVEQRDADGNNSLDHAIDNGHKDVATAIINCPRWKDALRNESIDLLHAGLRLTPMRKLIKKMPEVAEKVFNRCTTSNMSNSEHPNYQINFNYEFLEDQYSNWRSLDAGSDALSSADSIFDDEQKLLPNAKPYSKDATVLKMNHPLMLMVKTNQEDLLAHPLVTALLRRKWNSIGRYVYYLNLFIYCIFLTFLTGYIVTTKAPYMYYNTLDNSTAENECEAIREANTIKDQTLFAMIAKYVIMCLAGFKLLGEMFQMYNSKANYLGWENLIEWTTYIFAILLVIDINTCQGETGVRTAWQWQLGAIGIFLAWIDLVLFMRKVPRFGIYVVMFTDVLYTFIQFFPVFFLFIVAFALAFYALLQNQYEFRGVASSLIKTSVMMIGEFEFGDIFLSLENQPDPTAIEAAGDRVFYSSTTYTIFIFFLILMAIILMNLLIEFENFGFSLLKTSVMMIGEFEFGAIFLDGNLPDAANSDRVFYDSTTYVIFTFFLILVTIIIMNLLVGLAVDDIKAVQEQAVLKRLAMQVELALDVEAVLPQFIRRRFVRKSEMISPNEKSKNPFKRLMNIESSFLSAGAITKALEPELDEMEQLEENQEKMMGHMYTMHSRIRDLNERQEKLESMMAALLNHHGVQWQEEDGTNTEEAG